MATPPLAPPRHILPAILFCQVAGTSLWFSGNAVVAQLQALLQAPASLLGWLTSAAQLGFVAGTLVFTLGRVADRFSPRLLFTACCALGAALNLGVVWTPHAGDAGVALLLVLRFATGAALAGIYPVGMKIAAGWYRERLGNALGLLVGALVLGTALPHGALAVLHALPWEATVVVSSLLALAGAAVLYVWVPDGPYLAPALPAGAGAVRARLFADPKVRAVAMGYFGHMWELYTFWAFVPVLVAAHARNTAADISVAAWSFSVIAAGVLGCVVGGLLSQRVGSARVAFVQLCISGACCLLLPLAFLAPPAAFLLFLLTWGTAVVGDSPQFSTLAARHAPSTSVGSVLMAMNCTGFALTIVSIEWTSWLLKHLQPPWALALLAIGPAAGLLSFRSMLVLDRTASTPTYAPVSRSRP